jgi:hypothetical protein
MAFYSYSQKHIQMERATIISITYNVPQAVLDAIAHNILQHKFDMQDNWCTMA